MMPGSAFFERFSRTRHDALTRATSFAAPVMSPGFMMVVVAALRARLKGWKPSGRFTLGAGGPPVTTELVHMLIAKPYRRADVAHGDALAHVVRD